MYILKENCLAHKNTLGDTSSAFEAHKNAEFAKVKIVHLQTQAQDGLTISLIYFV